MAFPDPLSVSACDAANEPNCGLWTSPCVTSTWTARIQMRHVMQFFVSGSRNVTEAHQRKEQGERDLRKKHFVGFIHEVEIHLAAASTPTVERYVATTASGSGGKTPGREWR